MPKVIKLKKSVSLKNVVNGWIVEPLVVDRFLACVVEQAVSWQEAAVWLRDNACKAEHTTRRSPEGQPVYRLVHPWAGPPIALVVNTRSTGVRVAVTCGWWDEETLQTTPLLSTAQVRSGLPAVREADDDPMELPPLPTPPGDVSLGFLRPGLTLDAKALTAEESKAWQKWLGGFALSCSRANDQKRSQEAADTRRLLRKIAHENVERTMPSFKAPAGTPKQDRQTYDKALLDCLGEVLREELGQVEAHRLFFVAKERAWKRQPEGEEKAS